MWKTHADKELAAEATRQHRVQGGTQGVYKSNQTNFQESSGRFPGDILTKL